MKVVPIKVKIGLKEDGHADYPDWYKLPLAQNETPASNMFFGWKYDKTCGHKEGGIDSPYGMQWGMVLVSGQFAIQAVATFPDLVTILTEAEAAEFWDNKVTAHIPEVKHDNNVLQALQVELSLKESLGQDTNDLKIKIGKALDPDDIEVGIKRNKEKKFADAKIHLGFSIDK